MPPKLDQIVNDLEAAWSAGEQPSVGKFLDLVDENQRNELLARLLPIDIEQRIRAGDSVIAEDYADLGSDAIEIARQNLCELDSQGDQTNMPDNESIDLTSPLAGNQTTSSDDSESSQLPERIGRYGVQRILGKGGFGLVYLAQDEQLSRRVAIKVPHAKLLTRPEDAELYVTEAQTVANLDHPNIVPVYDVGSTPETSFFIVSKFIEGSDLASLLKKSRLSYVQSAELVATVAEALHHAHKQGLVHRDIKPGNILIEHGGKPYVVDFGLALREQDIGKRAGYIGTPSYMSPEQARGEGHRVDGRSDIFSLGVVFYELLLGRRPFRGDSKADLLNQIVAQEPRPPRQLDDSLPKELERICLKMLSKRASERYTTATDAAEDLRHFLRQETGAAGSSLAANLLSPAPITATNTKDKTSAATPTPNSQPIKIVPKGLRSFDQHDADFFLELLPGPQDRDGLPESIRFWKTRIEETDPDKTFSVGLIYGPSGCGKSSLVKAGLLPRLADAVIPIYVEATPEETESRLLKGLRRHCPGLPDNLTLKETLAALRRGQGITVGKKVLIVLDQFEQWLYSREQQQATDLVPALRQCDGERVQCIVMVRDDFWLAVSRFMRDLEVRLVEGDNSALADLFDADHARRVLTAFGRAFGRLPERELSEVQKQFLKESVAGLAEESKVVCVRLALFAEMMKGKTWSPATLKEVGGTQGIGATFLEETFSTTSAPPEHRYHQQAARDVLKALLPESDSDIKGHMKSYDELLAVSGYAARPKDFDDLIRVLDSEIRLITPTDPEGLQVDGEVDAKTAGQKYFQLTHDYLVPSLRAWLTQKQQETRKGRAELKLAERSASWNAKPENRQLPSLLEWTRIRTLTEGKNWTQTQQKMMGKAGRVHGIRSGLVTLAAAMVITAGFLITGQIEDRQNRNYASALVQSLMAANTADVENLVSELRKYHEWAIPQLKQIVSDDSADSKERLHASLALVAADPAQVDFLADRLLTGKTEEVPVIVRFLSPNKDRLNERLWQSVKNGSSEQQIRAAAALAEYEPQNDAWQEVNTDVVTALVSVPTVESKQWIDLLRPVGRQLVEPLEVRYRDRSPNRDAERPLVSLALADYLKNDWQKLTDLILLANNEGEFLPLLQALRPHQKSASPELQKLMAAPPKTESVLIRDAFWKQQANAAVCLLGLGELDAVWPVLKQSPKPSLRSFIIDRLARLGAKLNTLAKRLTEETDPSVEQAVILALGNFDAGKMSNEQRQSMVEQLATIYRTNSDPGIHSATGWTLRQWQQQETVQRLDAELGRASSEDKRNRFVNSQGQTFVVVDGPVEFLMGESVERKYVTIDYQFAIAAHEVSVAQFNQFRKDHKRDLVYAPQADCPVNLVSWYDAVAYCNWLSEQERIPKEQWCYEPNDKDQYAEGMKISANFLQRTGYRLPTEAEWEYACRAGTTSDFGFGDPEELLAGYAWYTANSNNQMGRVGLLRPNGLGLFDMHGNAWEWCHDMYDGESKGKDVAEVIVVDSSLRVLRGGSCLIQTSYVRSADRYSQAGSRNVYYGFRAARTYP